MTDLFKEDSAPEKDFDASDATYPVRVEQFVFRKVFGLPKKDAEDASELLLGFREVAHLRESGQNDEAQDLFDMVMKKAQYYKDLRDNGAN